MLLSGWAGRGALFAAAFPELCSRHPGLLGSVSEPDPAQLLIPGMPPLPYRSALSEKSSRE